MWFVPATVTVPNPDSVVEGKVPTSPVMLVLPTLLMPLPAKTEKLQAL